MTWLWKILFTFFDAILPENLRYGAIMGKIRQKAEVALGEVKVPKKRHPFLTGTRWVLHLSILAAILVGLWWVNQRFDLAKVLHSPWPVLHKVWLPLLFLLIYLLAWLGWWLLKLLGPEKETAEYPDIDAAWKEVLTALSEAGIDRTQVPLFLVLGQPDGTMEELFAATQLPFQVRHVPRRPDAPLHVFAGRDGLFVTCPGASLLGRQATLLAKEGDAGDPIDELLSLLDRQQEEAPPDGAALGQAPQAPSVLAAGGEPAGGLQTQVAEETPSASLAVADVRPADAPRVGKRRPLLLKNTDEVELLSSRLKYLCRLIVRDRQPYCPANGILLLIPLAATDSEADASQTGAICQHDLAAATEALQVHCPVFALVCNLEKMPGFCDLIDHFPEGRERQRPVGQSFPLVPDLFAAEVPMMIESSVAWIGRVLFPTLVYKLFRLEKAGPEERAEALHGNVRLYQLLWQMREREKRLARVLTRGVVREAGVPSLFGGCYLAATGADAGHEQAFVGGVFRQLVDNQNYVSWTADALAEESDYRRWTRIGYLGLGAFVGAVAALGYFFWW